MDLGDWATLLNTGWTLWQMYQEWNKKAKAKSNKPKGKRSQRKPKGKKRK
ncbi:MAG: hypothetical protein IJQ82_06275 [Selenomonadaceae bacterium]|nr:hypothetical protein [Selenomonadaceae bacterium]